MLLLLRKIIKLFKNKQKERKDKFKEKSEPEIKDRFGKLESFDIGLAMR